MIDRIRKFFQRNRYYLVCVLVRKGQVNTLVKGSVPVWLASRKPKYKFDSTVVLNYWRISKIEYDQLNRVIEL